MWRVTSTVKTSTSLSWSLLSLRAMCTAGTASHSSPLLIPTFRKQIIDNIKAYQQAFSSMSSLIGFSMKANYTPEILKIMREHGLSIITVSGFEIQLALKCGFEGKQIFFNGNGKLIWELELAIEAGCYLNVDSKFDARNICRVAEEKDQVVQVELNFIEY